MIYRNIKKGNEMGKRKVPTRIGHSRLARECAKLDPKFEKALAEEGLDEKLVDVSPEEMRNSY